MKKWVYTIVFFDDDKVQEFNKCMVALLSGNIVTELVKLCNNTYMFKCEYDASDLYEMISDINDLSYLITRSDPKNFNLSCNTKFSLVNDFKKIDIIDNLYNNNTINFVEKLDYLLDKIKSNGKNSLTVDELKWLNNY